MRFKELTIGDFYKLLELTDEEFEKHPEVLKICRYIFQERFGMSLKNYFRMRMADELPLTNFPVKLVLKSAEEESV